MDGRDYRPDLLEIGDTGDCIYLHAENCPGYCDYACNGLAGDRAAAEIEARWKVGDFTDAERADIAQAREIGGLASDPAGRDAKGTTADR